MLMMSSLPATTVRLGLGDHLDVAAIAYTGQRLPSKPIRRDTLQIPKLAQLARGIPRTQQRQVGAVDTVSIIGDLDEFQSTFFD